MIEKNINFRNEASYLQTKDIDDTTTEIWFICHGYGQLTPYFSRKFRAIDKAHRVLIFPEGLHRFYLSGTNGRVGASWMTKEKRALDIKNYVTYLNTLIEEKLKELHASHEVKIGILGFSQGAATVSRWVQELDISIDYMILWGGIFPEDLELNKISTRLKDVKSFVVFGKGDEFVKPDHFPLISKQLQNFPANVQEVLYDGGHDIDEHCLITLFESLS
ncbi:MAG: phospholipase [Cyclobacteriaceae bacterium]|nr:phospholipase [Cyclobacteriaceae bacterium]MCH8517110.1 phospholipase [Cyclobacteriaceae bacterium]